MFNKKTMMIVILALCVIGVVYACSAFHDTINKSKPQPSEDVLYKYTPDMQHISADSYGGQAERFELIGDRTRGTPPCFPAVSTYSSYVYYGRNETDERYLIASWYFNDEKQFMQARVDLATYIKEHGAASPGGFYRASHKLDGSAVTKYESNTTSGYFITFIRPFSADQNDYFIVYHGLMGSSQISVQTRSVLRKLMAEGYYNESGTVEPLLDEEYFMPPGWKGWMTGPGYPPPESMQVWYLPSPDYVSADFNVSAVEAILDDLAANGTCINETILAEHIPLKGVVVNETFAGHFSLIGERKAGVSPPFFPVLSQYCGYANYSRTGSDDRYLAGEWYFNDGEEFLRAEKELYQYLEEHGRVSTVELNISKGDVTKYECETTSGYFLVYKNTFGREGDYFIVYYGVVGSVDLSNQAPFLKALIADRYPTGPGVVGGLKSQAK